MNLFVLLFYIGIGLYLTAALAALFFSSKSYSNVLSMVISIAASVTMAAAAMIEYLVYGFEEIELTLFGTLFDPLRMTIRVDTFSTIFLIVTSISSIIITIYIYTATIHKEIRISYFKSSILANLFMVILSFILLANQSYFLTFLIGCAVVLIFIMLTSEFEDQEAAKRANLFLILGNIGGILITVAFALVLVGSGMLTVTGFEAALVPYPLRNITFLLIMTGIMILIGVNPSTKHSHIRLLLNGLFSKVILFIVFRFVVSLYSGNIALLTILMLLALGILFAGYHSIKAAVTIDGFQWLRHADLALNAICFISIIFSLYADNLGYSLIADQIRVSTLVMLLCSVVLYPAITIIIHGLEKADKSKRFKSIALAIFVPKALLPPIGGFAGIFIIISNISAMLDLSNFLKTLLLLASVFALIYVYLFYIYSHMKFFINVIDAGYEPEQEHSKRKISKTNLVIIYFSVILTFVTGFIPTLVGYGIAITYNFKAIVMLVSNGILMMLLVYFLNVTQTNATRNSLRLSVWRQAVKENGSYHMVRKCISFLFLLVAGTFFSVSHKLIMEGIQSYSILGVMYIILSIFLLYDKDIDFQDLYMELFMMLAITVDAVTTQYLAQYIIVKVLMGLICLLLIGFAIFRQRVKIRDSYDRFLANGKIYLYIAFFITFYANDIELPFGGFWSYPVYIVIGSVLFVLVYILASLICVHVFHKKRSKQL